MDIQDLDFKEVFQKPVDSPFFACHLEGQLSNQELETVVGGSKPVKTQVEGPQPALLAKEITTKVVVTKKVVVVESVAAFAALQESETAMGVLCRPDHKNPPYFICFEQI